jgi:hypothetical protein
MDKMEVKIGDYGRMMFEMMEEGKLSGHLPPHWESIREKAQPLVKQLIALNDEMVGGGYVIVGRKVKGKKVLSKAERIKRAQKKLWEVEASTLEVGDRVFYDEGEEASFVDDGCGPWEVEDVSTKGIYIDVQHCGGWHTARIGRDEKVIKAPKDWYENETYTDEWWLEQADKLGI